MSDHPSHTACSCLRIAAAVFVLLAAPALVRSAPKDAGKKNEPAPAPAPASPPPTAAPATAADPVAAARAVEEPPSAQFLDWINLCVEHLAAEDERVRAGATLALRFAGDAAKPALETAAASKNATLSAGAKRVLDQLDAPVTLGSRARPAPGRTGQSSTRVATALGLDDERRAAVEAILLDFDKRRLEILDKLRSGEADRIAVAKDLDTLRNETEARVDEHLDDEEMKRYRTLMPASSPARGDAPAGDAPDAKPPATDPPAEGDGTR